MPSSLEKFRRKHGQKAYNALIASIEGRAAPALSNNALNKLADSVMAPAQQALQSSIARVRGSSDVALNNAGLTQAAERGAQIASKGGFDHIITSSLQRSRNTGISIARHTNTPVSVSDAVQPWHLGIFEGEPVDSVKNFIARLANDHPSSSAPGRSATSTQDGESFNDFKQRWIGGFLAPLLEAHAQDPTSKVGIVTHLRNVLAAESWLKHGARRDMQFPHHDVDYESKVDKQEKTGSVFRIHPDGGKWKMDAIKDTQLNDGTPLEAGIYLIRHGQTDWNGGSGDKAAS